VTAQAGRAQGEKKGFARDAGELSQARGKVGDDLSRGRGIGPEGLTQRLVAIRNRGEEKRGKKGDVAAGKIHLGE